MAAFPGEPGLSGSPSRPPPPVPEENVWGVQTSFTGQMSFLPVPANRQFQSSEGNTKHEHYRNTCRKYFSATMC